MGKLITSIVTLTVAIIFNICLLQWQEEIIPTDPEKTDKALQDYVTKVIKTPTVQTCREVDIQLSREPKWKYRWCRNTWCHWWSNWS